MIRIAFCAGNWFECLLGYVKEFLGDAIGKLIELMFEPILKLLTEAIQVMFATIGTFWVYVPTPSIGSISTGAPSNDTVGWIWGHTEYIAIFVATIGVLVAAVQMAFTQRGEAVRDLLRSLMTFAVASALSIAAVQVLIDFGDRFADCIITTALTNSGAGWTCGGPAAANGDAFGASMLATMGFAVASGPIGVGLMITIGILTLLASVIQIVLMVVRTGMLILLLGVLPIAAAATNTEMGRNWFKRILSWLVAFILYKPVAALVYATAIRLTSNNGKPLNFTPGAGEDPVGAQVMNMVVGMTMLVLALFALPALMRFIAPMVAATAGSAGAGMLAAKMIGADKIADKASESAKSESDGPSGAKNVGKPSQQPSGPSGGQNPSPPSGGSSPPPSGGTGGASAPTSGGTAGATSGASSGAAAGGAAAGAGAAAGPVGIAVVAAAAAVKKGVDMTKEAGQAGANETIDNDAMDEGPSGSG